MIVLGSTGSIGVNTLHIAKRFNITVETLVAGSNITLLNQQIQAFKPKYVVVANASDIAKVNHTDVHAGEEAILEAIERSHSHVVVNALVGFLGLRPTLKAIECDKKVALANKESLVVAGNFVDTSHIIPIDSEHFALWYLMQNAKSDVKKMYITASGGAFRDTPLDALQHASVEDALKHPNWSMGRKITIDSATMVNKLFELLEARWLFGKGEYDAFIEPQSLLHGVVDFIDGSSSMHLANANMQLPIAFALREKVNEPILEPINLLDVKKLEFRAIETTRYPIWQIKDALLQTPQKGVVINAANEVAIEKFFAKKIGFMQISETILDAYERFDSVPRTLDDVFALDKTIREYYQ